MRAVASFAMRRRSNAIMVAVVFAMFAILLPPVAYLGSATVGLVTLRQGPRPGLWVILGSFLGVALLGLLIFENAAPALFFLLFLWLPLWLIAWLLRSTASQPLALEGAALLGALALVGAYLVIGDPAPMWRGALEAIVKPALEQAGMESDTAAVQAALDQVAGLMNGVLAASLFLSLVLSLLVARWWQAQLYNPGGFAQEFHTLRFHKSVGGVAIAVLVAAWLLPGEPGHFAVDLSLTVLVLYLFQGLAAVHGLVAISGANYGWLVALYAFMFFALPQMLMLLAAVGLADVWLNFRTRFRKG